MKGLILKVLVAFTALVWGIKSCLLEKSLRRLAIFPSVVGFFAYVASLISVYFSHTFVVSMFAPFSPGFFGTLVYYFIWLSAAIILLLAAIFLSTIIVLILTATVQGEISFQTLKLLGVEVSKNEATTIESVKSGISAMKTETLKLILLTPLIVCALLLGFIPFLIPVAIIISSWLLAFEFLDITLDVQGRGLKKRIGFCLRNFFPVLGFGLSLLFLWSIPFLGIFLTPAATSGGAWLVNKLETATK